MKLFIINQIIPIGISYGLSAIKNIGENSVLDLLSEREQNGEFKSLIDFLKRVSNKVINKKILEALVFSGSLSSLENNQNFLSKNIEKLVSLNVSFHKKLRKKSSKFV